MMVSPLLSPLRKVFRHHRLMVSTCLCEDVMRRWCLKTFLSGESRGLTIIYGEELDGRVIWKHPLEEGSIILDISLERAKEITQWAPFRKSKMNMRVEMIESAMGKEYRGSDMVFCPHCKVEVIMFDQGDALHGLPFCDAWRQRGL